MLNFGEALEALKEGEYVTRTEWGGFAAWIHLIPYKNGEVMRVVGEYLSGMSPYIESRLSNNTVVPWTPTHTDILAEDWLILPKFQEKQFK